MFEYVESVVALTASIALLALSVILVPNAVALGRRLRLSDLPAGGLLGTAAVAQMFFPVEPTPGVIVDLRIVPLVLAGAFLSLPSILLAVGMAVVMRLGVGGIGADAGVVSIMLAGAVGLPWRYLKSRSRTERRWMTYIGLALLACTTASAGLMLPAEVSAWFYASAAPVLMIGYLGIIPVFAWVIDRDFSLSSGNAISGRTTLAAFGITQLGLDTFLRYLRVSLAEGGGGGAALLCVRLNCGRGASQTAGHTLPDEYLDAALLRLKKVWPELETVCLTQQRLLLVPLTATDIQGLDRITETVKRSLTSAAFEAADGSRLWLDVDIGVTTADDIEQDGRMRFSVVRALASSGDPRKARATHAEQKSSPPEQERAFHFQSVDTLELLFKKADMLTRTQSWPSKP